MSFWYRSGACSNNGPSYREGRIGPRVGLGALLLACAVGAVARAQERQPPGMVVTLDVEQRLEYSDNPDLEVDGDADFYGRTVLSFGLDSVRQVDRFTLDFGTDIEEGRDDQSTLDPDNSFVNLAYTRDTRASRAAVSLRYREADVTGAITAEDFDQDGNVINQSEGSRASYGLRFDGAVGREAPVGASFSLSHNRIEYRDTNNPNQEDSTRDDFSGQIDFRITPRITASLTTLYRNVDTDGEGVDRKTTGFGSAVSLAVTAVDTFDIALSHDTIERSGNQSGTNEGLSGSLDWIREMPDGTLSVGYASEISTNDDGRRSFFNINRTMDLPSGSLSLTLGTTGASTVGTDPLVQADYVRQLSTAVLTFGISQSVNTDTNNNEEINTRLTAAYDQQINSLSGFGVNLSFFDRNELQDDPNDGQRLDVSLIYRHSLTRDWGLVGGYTHRFSTEDIGEDRRSNTVFVGLERNFSWTR